jgi:hypothetical protein
MPRRYPNPEYVQQRAAPQDPMENLSGLLQMASHLYGIQHEQEQDQKGQQLAQGQLELEQQRGALEQTNAQRESEMLPFQKQQIQATTNAENQRAEEEKQQALSLGPYRQSMEDARQQQAELHKQTMLGERMKQMQQITGPTGKPFYTSDDLALAGAGADPNQLYKSRFEQYHANVWDPTGKTQNFQDQMQSPYIVPAEKDWLRSQVSQAQPVVHSSLMDNIFNFQNTPEPQPTQPPLSYEDEVKKYLPANTQKQPQLQKSNPYTMGNIAMPPIVGIY